jgi:hypothetical protein
MLLRKNSIFIKDSLAMTESMTFLALKGFGDLTILLSFLMAQEARHTLIVRGGLEELARFYLADRHEIIVLNETNNVFGIYDLRRINLRKFINLYFSSTELRGVIKKLHRPILLDDESIRNKILFFGIKKKYLPRDVSIYKSYSSFFFCKPIRLTYETTVDSVAVFPFGSTISKTVNFFQIDNILSEHGLHNKSVLVYVHISDIHRIEKTDRYKVVILKNLSEIIDVVKKAEVVISVDTFQLHLAELYNKKIIIAGHINKKFIPNSIEY